MSMRFSEEVLNLKTEIIEDLTHFMKFGAAEDKNDPDYDPDFDAGYTQKNIDRCEAILDAFLDELSGHEEPEPGDIMDAVKTAVTALNEVNDQTDASMIETDQREMLCAFIIDAANEAGLDTDEDITEEWREW